MIKEILKTLSDTEIVAIAQEVINPKIDNKTIYNQLSAKSNDSNVIDRNDFKQLTSLVINELTNRLLSRDKEMVG